MNMKNPYRIEILEKGTWVLNGTAKTEENAHKQGLRLANMFKKIGKATEYRVIRVGG